ncbi:MAG: methyltransferase domain-containing protein, partial [Pyrinomonadaceae bacterium]
MKLRLLEYLACPSCDGSILLGPSPEREGAEVMQGELLCAGCDRRYPVRGGIPRFVELDRIERDKAATADNFGWQWQHFTQEDRRYTEQFLGWLTPVQPEYFADKLVLEGGCGKGRHTVLAAQWGARDVIGVDLSVAVEIAYAATRHLDNVHIIQADIYQLPIRAVFDYAFSVGVLHHLP